MKIAQAVRDNGDVLGVGSESGADEVDLVVERGIETRGVGVDDSV